jgi:hypothetical protein
MIAKHIVIPVLLGFLQPGVSAFAADQRYPDWPCRQLKVPELSVAAIWPGIALEKAASATGQYPGLEDLTAKLAARRTPMNEAEKQIDVFVAGTPAEKQAKAETLFAKLFDALNAQRSQVMNGLERAYRKQKEFAGKIRSDTEKLRELEDAKADETRLQELARQVEWETRIFEDRRKTMTYACEVPVAIDQRLFALAQAIRKAAGIA